MTDIAALLESVANTPRGSTLSARPCKITRLGLAETVATLSAQAGSHTITRVLVRLGHRVTDTTILRHTRGECGCPSG